jgi:hypothetical protein
MAALKRMGARVVAQFEFSSFRHGVIPKSRVFTSGTRNLTLHNAVEQEILQSPEKWRRSNGWALV